MKKRVISMLLVLVMALGLGAPVIADEGSGTVEEALTGAEELVDQGEGTTAPAVSEDPADEGEETPAPAASEEPADEGEETPAPVVPEEPADEGEPTPIEADGVAPIADTPAPAEQGEKVILHLAGETSAIIESYIDGDGRIIPVEDGTELDPGVRVYIHLKGEYQLSVDSGTVEYDGYSCQSKTGELYHIYSLFAPQSGTMTITVSKSEEEPPKVIHVQYAGETGRVVSLDSVKYALAGDYLMVAVSKGFTVTAVEGGSVDSVHEDESGVYHTILVDGNAVAVKVTVGAAKQIKVNITGNGQVKRMDGTVVQPGETVYENTELRLPDRTLYAVTVSDNVRWNNRSDDAGEYRTIVVTDSDGDGEITITITEAAMVTFRVQGETDMAVFKDQRGNVVSDGSRFSEYVDQLNVELQPGYTVVGDCTLITDGGKTIGISIDDPDKDGIITVAVTEAVTVHFDADASGLKELKYQGASLWDGAEVGPREGIYVALEAGYQASVDDGELDRSYYYCDPQTGELTNMYYFLAPESGAMTVTVSKSEEEPPKVIPVQYEGETGQIANLEYVQYVLPGEYLTVRVSKGFTVTAVEGGSVGYVDEEESGVDHTILIEGNAVAVKVTIGAAKQIKVNIEGDGQVKRMDGTVVQPGDMVYEYTRLVLPNWNQYTVTVSDGIRISMADGISVPDSQFIDVIDNDGDGEITITITEAVKVTFHVLGAADKAVFKYDNRDIVSDGTQIGENVRWLDMELQPGYTVVGECSLMLDYNKVVGIYIQDQDGDGSITVTVTEAVTVHFDADASGLKELKYQGASLWDGVEVGPREEIYVALEAGYQASVDDGELDRSYYYCDPQTGELTNTYYFLAPESGTMNITVSPSSEEPPKAIPITYEGTTEQILEESKIVKYVLSGGKWAFDVPLNKGYAVTSVEGGSINGVHENGDEVCYTIFVDGNAVAVKVTIGVAKQVKVNIVGNGQIQRKDGTVVQSGDLVYENTELRLPDRNQYTVTVSDDVTWNNYSDDTGDYRTIVVADSDGDGEITITIIEGSVVTFHVQGEKDKAVFKDQSGNVVSDGARFSEYVDRLNAEVQPGYTVVGDCGLMTDGEKITGIRIDDPDKDGIITVTVVEAPVTVVMEGETKGFRNGLCIYDVNESGIDFWNGSSVPAGSTLITWVAPGYKMEFENAEVTLSDYWYGLSTGEMGRFYTATAPASGTVTITAVKMAEGEETRRMVPVEYDDPDGKVYPDDKQQVLYFVYAPEPTENSIPNFLSVAEEYELSVTGGTATRASDQSWAPEGYVRYFIAVDASAEKVVVSVRAKTPATPEPTDTPEPEPEVTPEPSPEVTPTPVPSPEVTPEPSPEPTPEPVTPDAPASGDGWSQNENGDWFFFEDGQSVTESWVNDGGQWYYPDTTGKVLVGLQTIEGDGTYYFNPVHDGTYGAALSGWREVNGSWYYFNEKHDGTYGKMETGWIYQGGDWYYTDRTTGAMTTGWLEVGGQTFYMKPTGRDAGVLQSGWQKVEDKWYYFNEKHDGSFGAMERDDWVHSASSGLWYYVDQDGVMLTGLQEIDGELYYLNPEDGATVGAVLAGWHEIDGVWYHFNEKHNGSYGACTWHG